MNLQEEHPQPAEEITSVDGGESVSTFEDDNATRSATSSGAFTTYNESAMIASNESKLVFKLRFMVLFVILIAALAVSTGIYILTRNSEHEEFRQQFLGAALKVSSSFEGIVDQKLAAVASLSLQVSLFAAEGNLKWPFVTLPKFAKRAAVARQLSKAIFTRIVPMVQHEDREAWEEYSMNHSSWLQDEPFMGFPPNERRLQTNNVARPGDALDFSTGIANRIFAFNETGFPMVQEERPFYFPLWQESPTFGQDVTNWDMENYAPYAEFILKVLETKDMAIGGIETAPPGGIDHADISTSYFSFLLSIKAGKWVDYDGRPMSTIFVPIFEDFEAEERKLVGVVFAVLEWGLYFENLLPSNFPGVVVVLKNDCGETFTYSISGRTTEALGRGDRHDKRYDSGFFDEQVALGKDAESPDSVFGMKLNQDICAYKLELYPSQELENQYVTSQPIIVAVTVLIVFSFTAAAFLLFNCIVERRQSLVMKEAVRSTALVTSLFPEGVRDRLMDESKNLLLSGKSRLKNFLSDDGENVEEDGHAQPIADLFPFCTVFFGDIAGFTAYSSTREPSQIFILLETIYQAFDILAKRRGVFKVETIGDSYVAVTGLPNPNERHALSMARFAMDCLKKFKELTKQLENTLGPDTADLGMRIGLHSGPVTAGVLRGERSRFQLFGDTVNTAARMESTGVTNRIQMSHATAELLRQEGKENWIVHRDDAVHAKGKGVLETFWLQPKTEASMTVASNSSEGTEQIALGKVPSEQRTLNQKSERLVNWVVDTFSKHLSKIIALRGHDTNSKTKKESLIYHLPDGRTSLDEVVEVIKMPTFNKKASARAKERGSIEIDVVVGQQLKEVITRIASLYNANPFHNFEHACHVTMAVDKFLSRIETPDIDEYDDVDAYGLASQIHDFTHGITSDPTTVLAIVFAALVHDADHRGVSNQQLAKEDMEMASMYQNQSIAEQHSLDECWSILMDVEYHELRLAIFANRTEMLRFRQVLVNVVLATDIFDKQLNDLRKNRWDKAFDNNGTLDSDLRATIVIEHIIQASDVAHTMQHWHIYRKWNGRLFKEMYEAFQQGRMATNPAEFWYKGEIGFFDNYVIPLARKLQECNVFGVSSDECLNYALANRSEWEHRGDEVVATLVESQKVNDGLSELQ